MSLRNTAKRSRPPKSSSRHFAIVGAGIAGVACARTLVQAGHLVECQTERSPPSGQMHCAWRMPASGKPGHALQWWLERFEHEGTRRALLENHRSFR